MLPDASFGDPGGRRATRKRGKRRSKIPQKGRPCVTWASTPDGKFLRGWKPRLEGSARRDDECVLSGVRRGEQRGNGLLRWASPMGLGDFGAIRRRSSLTYRGGYASLLAPCLSPKSLQPTRKEFAVGSTGPRRPRGLDKRADHLNVACISAPHEAAAGAHCRYAKIKIFSPCI